MSKIRYRPEIDGLRALAILPVILFHLNVPWLSGGFVGVDVFFVISGFLITSILLKDIDLGTFTLGGFWLRRIRRLVPALGTMLVCTLLAGRLVLLTSDLKYLGLQGVAATLSAANFFFWQAAGNYWGPQAHEQPLLHMWSLAVEEQFYFLYPVSLVVAHRLVRRHLLLVASAGTALSFVLCLYATYRHPTAAFYLLPARAWELGCGCLLAIHRSKSGPLAPSSRWAQPVTVAGIFGIVVSCFVINGSHPFPGYAALLPVISTAAIIAFGDQPQGLPRLLLTNPLAVYIGKASYSLYLWHWPVIVLVGVTHITNATIPSTWKIACVIVVLGLLSYHLIERIGKTQRLWIPYVSAAVALALMTSSYYVFAKHRYDLAGFAPVEWYGRQFDTIPEQIPWPAEPDSEMRGIVSPVRDQPKSDAFKNGGIIHQHGSPIPRVVVIGDSHALMWASAIDGICREQNLTISFYAADGTPAVFSTEPERRATTYFSAEQKYEFDAARLRYLKEWKPELIILLVRWDVWELTEAQLTQFMSMLSGLASRMIVVSQPPIMFYGNRSALRIAAELRERGLLQPTLPTGERGAWQAGNALARSAIERLTNCEMVDISDIYLRENGRARFIDGDRILYIDEDHLSEYGASLARDRLRSAVVHAAAASR